MTSAPARPRLLVTGAAGRVGTALRPLLRHTHDLLLFDREPAPAPYAGETVLIGNLAEYRDVAGAVRGVDAVLHLACVHGLGLRFEDSLDANFTGTVNLLEGVRASGVVRLVYASSHHVLGLHPLSGFRGDDAEFAPDAVYGLGKAFGELACRTYAQRYGIATLVIRIGNADRKVTDARSLRLWTSARDLAQLVLIGLEHPDIGFDVVYGVSASPDPLFANERARELGYRPVDAADEVTAALGRHLVVGDEVRREVLGGGYA
ncbi:MAG TPA: NAD(P)-dependent oxidoreductase, partial [Trueperaceae bacterium]|nr:NAD(P)-dependent oxidoreductase [Trueperaceae bacterium]